MCNINYFYNVKSFCNEINLIKSNLPLTKLKLQNYCFRTYEENGLLFYHTFSSEGFVKVFMEEARVKVQIVSRGMPEVKLDNFDQVKPN